MVLLSFLKRAWHKMQGRSEAEELQIQANGLHDDTGPTWSLGGEPRHQASSFTFVFRA